MPIGKNSIKRVANNGYSNVKTDAPDMENSVVAEEATKPAKAAEKTAKAAPVAKKQPAKKPCAKKATAPKKAEAPKAEPIEKNISDDSSYVAVGEDMPVYLL